MSYYGKEDELRRKYAPIPDEPRHKKKAKKRHVRSDHKHVYEEVCIDADTYSYDYQKREKVKKYQIGKRCMICGRLDDVTWDNRHDEPPKGMRLFKVDGIKGLFAKVLSEDLEVKE